MHIRLSLRVNVTADPARRVHQKWMTVVRAYYTCKRGRRTRGVAALPDNAKLPGTFCFFYVRARCKILRNVRIFFARAGAPFRDFARLYDAFKLRPAFARPLNLRKTSPPVAIEKCSNPSLSIHPAPFILFSYPDIYLSIFIVLASPCGALEMFEKRVSRSLSEFNLNFSSFRYIPQLSFRLIYDAPRNKRIAGGKL